MNEIFTLSCLKCKTRDRFRNKAKPLSCHTHSQFNDIFVVMLCCPALYGVQGQGTCKRIIFLTTQPNKIFLEFDDKIKPGKTMLLASYLDSGARRGNPPTVYPPIPAFPLALQLQPSRSTPLRLQIHRHTTKSTTNRSPGLVRGAVDETLPSLKLHCFNFR